jgi:single-strand selective monofunctional uracil DNA glycosylase
MEATGANRTPDKLPAAEAQALFDVCDDALRDVVRVLEPRIVIGVGGFAERRARAALVDQGVTCGAILHPSPASPLANRDWAGTVEQQFGRLGVAL